MSATSSTDPHTALIKLHEVLKLLRSGKSPMEVAFTPGINSSFPQAIAMIKLIDENPSVLRMELHDAEDNDTPDIPQRKARKAKVRKG